MLQIVSKLKSIFPILFFLFIIGCAKPETEKSIINTAHLDYLYEDVKVNGKTIGIVHIYSDYPDYKWIDDDDEGTACVDDAARAAIFYLKYGKLSGDKESLRKAKNLLEFVVYLQSDNGYFYNFMWKDGSINKDFKTSVNEPNWWTWRAVWSLMEGYEYYKDVDDSYAERLLSVVKTTMEKVKKDMPVSYATKDMNGFTRPTWLPFETASDQAAAMLLGFTSYYNVTKDDTVLTYCKKLADGILLMQEGGARVYPYGAFLSWENTWHGWGNSQSDALLKLYDITKDETYKSAALKELDNFYDYLIKENFYTEFTVKKVDGKIVTAKEQKFSQIAYIIRPMVFALVKAHELTKEQAYADKAVKVAEWFFGGNPAGMRMYFPEDGKCYDGIHDDKTVNKNSGAESTIECLLSLTEIESNPAINQKFKNTIRKNE